MRGYSRGYSAVRAHRYVREVRADDADVAGAPAGDTHEPAAVIGLHTPRRAKLAAAPAQGFAGGTPLHCEYSKHRGGNAGRVLRVLAAHAVRHCAAHQRRGAAGREPRCAGTQEGARQCVRTVMFARVELTTLTWPVLLPPWSTKAATSPPRSACTPHAAQSSPRRPTEGWPAVPHCAASTLSTEAVTPVGYCGCSQPTPCGTARQISGAEPPDGSRGARVLKRVLGSACAPLCL